MAHPVMWFEVMGQNGEALQQFYRQLFGWYIDADNPMKYGVVETGAARGIPGGVGQATGEHARPWVTVYVESPDVTVSLADAVRLGGKVLMPRTALPDNTVIGLFEDLERNVVGLVEAPRAEAPPQPQAQA